MLWKCSLTVPGAKPNSRARLLLVDCGTARRIFRMRRSCRVSLYITIACYRVHSIICFWAERLEGPGENGFTIRDKNLSFHGRLRKLSPLLAGQVFGNWRSFRFGRTKALSPPHLLQIMRRANDRTSIS